MWGKIDGGIWGKTLQPGCEAREKLEEFGKNAREGIAVVVHGVAREAEGGGSGQAGKARNWCRAKGES